MSKKNNDLLHKIILVIKWNSTDIIKLAGKWTLYFKSWHLTPMTAWWPITLLRPKTVRPGRWSPTTAPLPNTQFSASFFQKQIYIHIVTLINQWLVKWTDGIKRQWSPISVFPKTWLPGYNRHPFPSFTEDPIVQYGPIETPYTNNNNNNNYNNLFAELK